MNGSCFSGDTDRIDCENALPQLVSRYVVNQGYFEGNSDRIDRETASPVLVLGCKVTSEATVIGLVVKQLHQCLCWGA